jgi:hypothetical protein
MAYEGISAKLFSCSSVAWGGSVVVSIYLVAAPSQTASRDHVRCRPLKGSVAKPVPRISNRTELAFFASADLGSMLEHNMNIVLHCYDAQRLRVDSERAGGGSTMRKNFFEQRSEESLVKAQIVDKYFRAWARIMAPRSRNRKIAYVD